MWDFTSINLAHKLDKTFSIQNKCDPALLRAKWHEVAFTFIRVSCTIYCKRVGYILTNYIQLSKKSSVIFQSQSLGVRLVYSDPDAVRCVYLKHLPDMRKPVQLWALVPVWCVGWDMWPPPLTSGAGCRELRRRAQSCTLAAHPILPGCCWLELLPLATDLDGGGDGGHDGGGGGGAGHPGGHHGGQGRGHGAGHQHSDVWCLWADEVKVIATFVLVLVWSLPWLPGTQAHGLWLMCSAFTCS